MHADRQPGGVSDPARSGRATLSTSPGLRVAGFPLRIQPSFFILSALLAGPRSLPLIAVWVAVVFVSVLVHELGHAVVFRAFGIPAGIELYSMGGLTRPTGGGTLTPLRLLGVSVAGPVAGLGLGLLVLAAASLAGVSAAGGIAAEIAGDLIYVNIAWSLANLLPILPLDGGHVMQHLLDVVTRRDTELLAQAISLATVVAVITWALSRGLHFTAGIIAVFWAMGAAAYWQRRLFNRDQPLREQVQLGWRSLSAGDSAAAVAIARGVLDGARSRSVRAEAARLLALGGVAGGRPEVAGEGLARMPKRVPVDPYLEGVVALVADRNEAAVRLLTDAFAATPDDRAAAPLTQALIRSGRPDDAVALVVGPQGPRVGQATHLALVSGLHAAGLFREAAERGEAAHARWPEARLAYNTGCSWARCGEPDRSCDWLLRAVASGWTDVEQLQTDPDLNSVRDRPGYRAALSRLLDLNLEVNSKQDQGPEHHRRHGREKAGDGVEVVEEVVTRGHDDADNDPENKP